MASLMPQGKQAYFDANGDPLSGGRLYTYAAGTSTPLATYSDEAGATPNTNPVVLDARGEATVFWSAAPYKVVLTDSADVTVWTQDNVYVRGRVTVTGGSTPRTLEDHLALLPDSKVLATGSTTARALKDRFTVNVLDFGAKCDGVTDDHDAVQAAIDTDPGVIEFPAGTCKINSTITMRSGLTLLGKGKETGLGLARGTKLDFSGLPNGNVALNFNGLSDVRVIGFYIQGHGAAGTVPDLFFVGNNRRIRLQDLAVVATGAGILVDFNAAGGSTINSVIDNVVISGSGLATSPAALYIGAACTSIDVTSVYANALPTGVGFQIMGTYITLHSCAADGNLWGYYVYGAKSVSIVGSGAEQSLRSAVWARGVDGLSIVGFRSYENSADALYPSFLYLTNAATRVSTMNTLDDGASVGTYSVGWDATVTDGKLAFIHHSSPRAIHPSIAHTALDTTLRAGRAIVSPMQVQTSTTGGAAVDIDASLANEVRVSVLDNTAFTINAPTNPTKGQRITVRVRNAAGVAMGAVTWNAVFKMAAFTNPADTFSRSVDFQYDGAVWIEVSRTPADVPN